MSNTDLSHLDGAQRISEERSRQIALWGHAHDIEHDDGSLARAAWCYLEDVVHPDNPLVSGHWPWEPEWWKPSADPIRNLEKAGALIAAEIDRRAAASGETT